MKKTKRSLWEVKVNYTIKFFKIKKGALALMIFKLALKILIGFKILTQMF